jgi:hypothetical protein
MKKLNALMITLLAATMLVATGCNSNGSSTTDNGSTTDDSSDSKKDSGDTSDDSGSTNTSDTLPTGTAHTTSTNISYGTIGETSATIKIGNTSKTYKATKIYSSGTTTLTNETISTSDSDTNCILVCNGATLNLVGCTLTKTGDGTSYSNDDYNFYGLNAAIICIGTGSTINMSNCKITTNGEGANAVFSFAGAVINILNINIATSSNSSRGLYSTYNGSIYANAVNIVTQGAHCAPLATDRGGGYVIVGGTTNYLEAHGDGSPCIYSTGDIELTNGSGYSEEAQTLVIEGKNIVKVYSSSLTSKAKSSDGIMLYQSMSGDASDSDATSSVSTLTLDTSKIIYEGTTSYGLFLITNTKTVVNCTDTTFTNADETLIFAGVARWGTTGSNGGNATFNFTKETLDGKIDANATDSKITVNFTNSTFNGTTNGSVTINK